MVGKNASDSGFQRCTALEGLNLRLIPDLLIPGIHLDDYIADIHPY
jgi:hypothetical protein